MSHVVPEIDSDTRLREAVRRLATFAPVERIILFGSRARGDHSEDSDFDLCVILNDDIAAGMFTPISLWREVSDLGIPIQIAPLRSSAFETARHDPTSLSHDIDRDGRVIYQKVEPALSP
ncbi:MULTISPECIES: nucleotidyltransferase domain-containing protein [Rhodopseudomonas]|uniref:DNA polymerase III subunit beta n=1 Tax=Rhodopseudomonas palustris TaxID=1076 RepID=A0A0D7F5V5_RHOPL|nr:MULTISPECIES: nucleotidyltransferase domain-containing protein [Rhodopseudomonas]KIZ48166.1 DNA polymerase III subunit beta [Rhodopseudomonas palustris]MDF3812044.1 nucleotidyltransferase domain-containing protein [Rhodopseudomonas sp. BAL398]WOK16096.1 nucleotidyltransferase domain-containing protein [Rhodopseudomonas sp. BAL398]